MVSTTALPSAVSVASASDRTAASIGFTPELLKAEKTFRIPGIAFCMARLESSSHILVGSSDTSVYRLETDAEKVEAVRLSETRHGSYVTGIVRSANQLITAGYDCSIIWWNVVDGSVVRRQENAHEKWIRMLAISPDGQRIASVADDMKTRVWDTASGECVATFGDYAMKTPHHFPSMLYAVAYSADGKWLATGDRTGRVLVRDVLTGAIAAVLEVPAMYTWDPKARRHSIGGVRSLSFSADSRLLAIGGMGQVGNIDHLDGASRIEVFRWETQERLCEIEDNKFKGLVEVLQFASDDRWLVAAGGNQNGFVSAYDVADGKLLVQEKAPMHVHDLELHCHLDDPDSRRTAVDVSGADKAAVTADGTGTLTEGLPNESGAVPSAVGSATIVAVGHEQGAVMRLSGPMRQAAP